MVIAVTVTIAIIVYIIFTIGIDPNEKGGRVTAWAA